MDPMNDPRVLEQMQRLMQQNQMHNQAQQFPNPMQQQMGMGNQPMGTQMGQQPNSLYAPGTSNSAMIRALLGGQNLGY